MELIFLIGLAWAASRGIGALKAPAAAHWAKYRAARTGRDNTPAARAQRRAASTAVLGFWAGEITRGMPHLRHGFAQGWAEHRDQVTQRERERARASLQRERDATAQDADDAGWWARTQAELAAHRHRLEVARARAERKPTMSEQLGTYPGAGLVLNRKQAPNGDDLHMRSENCTNPDCTCHASDPPLADGKTPGSGSPGGNGHTPATSPNGHSPQLNGGTVAASGDMNYDVAVETSDKLIAAAEQAANDEALSTATTMADELGGMTPDDSAMLSLAADVVAAAQKLKDGAAELQDQAVALKSHLVTNYGPIQEAVDAGPGAAPEKQFVDH